MTEAAILALLQAVPGIFSTLQSMIANGQIKEQATLDAAIKAQQAAALTDFTQLQADLS